MEIISHKLYCLYNVLYVNSYRFAYVVHNCSYVLNCTALMYFSVSLLNSHSGRGPNELISSVPMGEISHYLDLTKNIK